MPHQKGPWSRTPPSNFIASAEPLVDFSGNTLADLQYTPTPPSLAACSSTICMKDTLQIFVDTVDLGRADGKTAFELDARSCLQLAVLRYLDHSSCNGA